MDLLLFFLLRSCYIGFHLFPSPHPYLIHIYDLCLHSLILSPARFPSCNIPSSWHSFLILILFHVNLIHEGHIHSCIDFSPYPSFSFAINHCPAITRTGRFHKCKLQTSSK